MKILMLQPISLVYFICKLLSVASPCLKAKKSVRQEPIFFLLESVVMTVLG